MTNTRWSERDEQAFRTLRAHGATHEVATIVVENQRKSRRVGELNRKVVLNETTRNRVSSNAAGQVVAVPEQGWHRPYRVVGSTNIGARQLMTADIGTATVTPAAASVQFFARMSS